MTVGIVFSQLHGGLGNQLFQYAVARALALRTKSRLVLDATELARPGNGRRYELAAFSIAADLTVDGYPYQPWRRFVPLWRGRLVGQQRRDPLALLARRLASRLPSGLRWPWRAPVFTPKSNNYDEDFAKRQPPQYLVGFWQSARYFRDIELIIRSDLRPARAPGADQVGWLARFRDANSVCMHVRRGDYLQHPHLGACSLDYYKAAMALARARLAAPRFFVFSDDWAWARAQFADPDTVLVDANGPDEAVDELLLMAACRHHIIANSSLSWWGAWLAKHRDQMVIAPHPWFTYLPDSDLLLDGWITLPRG